MEMDIYWVVRSGKDPLELMAKHPDVLSLCTLRIWIKQTNLNTEIGKGTIDYVKY
jgi:hypothetical protein